MEKGHRQVLIAFTDTEESQEEKRFVAFVTRNITKLMIAIHDGCQSAFASWDGNYTGTMAILEANDDGWKFIEHYFQSAPMIGKASLL